MPNKSTKPMIPSPKLIAAITRFLADTFALAVKSHGYHWNVTGSLFKPLHEFLQAQYEELYEAADDIAERIRALDATAPVSMAQMLAATKITETKSATFTATAMLQDLAAAHDVLLAGLKAAEDVADETDDTATEDLLASRRRAHEKTLWMIKAQLKV
jgi:starvation-inducible DNA-binding protein